MQNNKYIFIVQVTRQLSIDIINRFAENGANIVLVTGIVESNYATLHPNVNVRYFNNYNSSSAFKRLFTWSIFTVLSFFYVLFKSRRYELILVSTPPFILFLGNIFKRWRNQHYHLVVWDLYPDVLVNMGVATNNSFLIRFWKKKNIACFQKAENVFTLGKHLADAINVYGNVNTRIIYNWTNTDFIKPLPKSENKFAKTHLLENKFVVMYSGNLGLTHDIESIVYSAELLKQEKNIQFIIIGDGAKKPKIQLLIKEKSLTNVLLLPHQPKEMLPFSLTSADIGVVTLSKGAESVSVPSKTYYTLAAGTPILAIAANDSELGLLIDHYHCGKVFANSGIKKIADYIKALANDQSILAKLKSNARKASFDFTSSNAQMYYDYICGVNKNHA